MLLYRMALLATSFLVACGILLSVLEYRRFLFLGVLGIRFPEGRAMKHPLILRATLAVLVVTALALGSAWAKGPPPEKGGGKPKEEKADHTARQATDDSCR